MTKSWMMGWVSVALCAASAVAATPGNYNLPDAPSTAVAKPVATFTPIKPIRAATEADAPDVARVEAYLSTISSIVADFTQISADGSVGAGKFYLKRPGKMRWQYAPPTPILLVSDGKVITYYDAGLDQVSYIGIDDTLAGFLAKKDILLNSASTRLTNFEVKDGFIRATVVQKAKPAEGSLTLEFTDKPIQFSKMMAIDATGNATTIQLSNAQFGPVLDNKMFIFEDSRSVHRKRR
ncbi:MAG: outer membrane lipoprotein carrier protein LolA [Pseudomonadota bacterium]